VLSREPRGVVSSPALPRSPAEGSGSPFARLVSPVNEVAIGKHNRPVEAGDSKTLFRIFDRGARRPDSAAGPILSGRDVGNPQSSLVAETGSTPKRLEVQTAN